MTRQFLSLHSLVFLLLVVGQPDELRASDFRGNVSIGSGYLENPRGVESDHAATYLSQTLRLALDLGEKRAYIRVGYEGSASQFDDESQLGSIRHSLGVELFNYADNGYDNLSAGIQGSERAYEGYFGIYDYNDIYSYLAFKRRGSSPNIWRGFVALRARRYQNLLEESFLEPHGQLQFIRTFANRTTVGVSVSYGIKYYDDPVASRVWETPNLPSVSQLAARLNFSKNFSDRVGLRGWGEYRLRLSDFPAYVADDIYDSPLLDTYAQEGTDAFLAVRWLMPHQIWFEVGASGGDHDYGALMFASSEGGATRKDQVLSFYGSARRQLGQNLGRARLQATCGWRDNESNLSSYTYSGIFVSSSISWRW